MTPLQAVTVPSVVSVQTFIWSLIGIGVGSPIVASFLLLAGLDRLIIRRLKHDEVSPLFDGLIVAAITRKKVEIMALLNDWYALDRARNEQTAKVADVNSDRIEWVEKSVMLQGEELSKQSRQQHESTAHGMAQMTRTLEGIQKEAQATAIAIVRIETRMNEWDGHDRRRHHAST